MSAPPAPPRIFDDRRRALRRDRLWRRMAATPVAATPVFHERVAEDLLERLDSVTRPLTTALLLNPNDPALATGLARRGLGVTEVQSGPVAARLRDATGVGDDSPDLPPGPFDLVMSAGGLDSVNDVPGALSLWRRALKPDGLLLASFPGAGSFAAARRACLDADIALSGGAVARFHPLIEVRTLGDLAARAGLVLPVAEVDAVALSYPSLFRVFSDLREHGWTQVLGGPMRPLSRRWLAEAAARFADRADGEGRVAERLNLLTLTAWSPGPDQPRPAARGSGRASLTSALRGGSAGASTPS